MELAPILVFVYNRPEHTKKTIEALKKNKMAKDSLLFIFADASKNKYSVDNVNKVREYLKTIDGFKRVEIIERKNNFGLAKSIIMGVTEIINKYGKVIVLEDDLVTASNFIEYMNEALVLYEKDKRIYSVTGYNHPPSLMKIPTDYRYDVYLCPRAASWSWATWKNRWNTVDWEVKDFNEFVKDKKRQRAYNYSGDDKTNMLISQMKGLLDSWAIRWDYHHFKNDAFCVYPVVSLVDNIGHDGTGVHCGKSIKYRNNIMDNKIRLRERVEFNSDIVGEFRKVYKANLISRIKMLIAKSFLYKVIKKI